LLDVPVDPGLTAALAVGLAGYAAYLFDWTRLLIKLVAILVILALCLLNVFGTPAGAGFMQRLTWLKLGLVGSLTVWAIAFRVGVAVELRAFRGPTAGLNAFRIGIGDRCGGCVPLFSGAGGT
jgi:amino acid transporter